MTIEELLDRMSSEEIAAWEAYDALEPIGDLRRDFQAGLIAATLVHLKVPKSNILPTDFIHFGEDADRKRDKTAAARKALKEQGAMTVAERTLDAGLEAAIKLAERSKPEPQP